MDIPRSKIIYLDNAATTRLKDEALAAMMPYLKESYANPGGAYDFAGKVKRDVAVAREETASAIGARPTEIFFTGGGSESDNQALRGLAELKGAGIPHIITTSFEHHAVLNTCKYLEKKGLARISYVNPNASGMIDPSDVERLIDRSTVLISVMTVNNELGSIQPISEIGRIAHEHGALFHTDAVAAVGHIPIDVKKMNIDLLSASAHKFGGPKGIGFLYVKENFKLPPLIYGGAQERGRRAGTENVPGIIGMTEALKSMVANMNRNLARRQELDRYFIKRYKKETKDITMNGPLTCLGKDTMMTVGSGTECLRLPGHFSITLPGINAEELVVKLGIKGICVSTGAACASSNDEESHVLKAVGLKGDSIKSTIRISMNEDNTEDEIDFFYKEVQL